MAVDDTTNFEPLGTEKDDPVDIVDPEDFVDPDEFEDGPDEDYPDDDGVIEGAE